MVRSEPKILERLPRVRQPQTYVLKSILWAFSNLNDRRVLTLLVIPSLIHSSILVGGLWAMYSWLSEYLLYWQLPAMPEQLAWLSAALEHIAWVFGWIILMVVMLGILAFGISTLTTIAHVIASPFNAWLAAGAEATLRPLQHPEVRLRAAVFLGLHREWRRFRYWLLKAAPLLVLTLFTFWIPIVNTFISVAWVLFGAWMVGLQALDYVADNNGISFDTMLSQCRKYRLSTLGLGGGIMALMLVPGINLFSMAISVLAGTHLWVEAIGPISEAES